MNRNKKFGIFMIILPIILLLIPLVLTSIEIPIYFYYSCRLCYLVLWLYEYSPGFALSSFVLGPIYILIGIYLMIKYRDNKKPILEILKERFNFKERFAKVKKNYSPKTFLNDILILIAILSPIAVLTLASPTSSNHSSYTLFEKLFTDLPPENIDTNMIYIKERLKKLIPEKYIVTEREFYTSFDSENTCELLFFINPKNYTEIEKKYLHDVRILYCEDIDTAVVKDQIKEIKYSKIEDKWVYNDEYYLEKIEFGDNIVSVAQLGGDYALYNYYILKFEDTDEVLVLDVPLSHTVSCWSYDYEDNVDKECVEYMSTSGTFIEDTDWVKVEVYEKHYDDLLRILEEI